METSRVSDGGRATPTQAARAVSRPVEEAVPVTPAVRNPTVLGIGFASLLSDTGHEMATAAMPGFLTSLGAPAAALGAIEGIVDASLSASKLAGGVLADRPGRTEGASRPRGGRCPVDGHGPRVGVHLGGPLVARRCARSDARPPRWRR